MTDGRYAFIGEPWERQPFDTDPSFEAFCVYRDAGPRRNVQAMGRDPNRNVSSLTDWCRLHSWRYRAAAYDAHLDRIRLEERAKSVRDMEERHAAVSAAALAQLGLPILAMGLPRIDDQNQEVPRLMDLRRLSTPQLVRLVANAARAIGVPSQVERLARGEATEIHGGSVEVTHDLPDPAPDEERVRAFYRAMEEAGLLIGVDEPGTLGTVDEGD